MTYKYKYSDEALKLALEALKAKDTCGSSIREAKERAITACEQALAAPVQEPVNGTQVSKVWWDGEKLMAKPIPLEDIYQPVDWKAEYLKSVESGCITLDELREANAELEATNRQVEILSDALAESRREVASLKANAALDKKAENARELGLDYEPVLKDNSNYRYDPPVAEPVAVKHMMGWVESLKRQSDYGQHMRIPGLNAGACFELAIELEQFINTTPPAQPAQVPIKGAVLNKHGGVTLCQNGHEESTLNFAGRLFATPPAQPAQRTWVDLTDGEIDAEANSILTSDPVQWWRRFARAVLAKSKEKNHEH